MTKPLQVSTMLWMPLLAACSAKTAQDYSDWQPQLVPENFFQGQLVAHGVVTNWQGDVIRHFNADIEANWQDGVATLDEHFVFNDGEKQRRVWTLASKGNGLYQAAANDVVGTHDMRVAGNALFMQYVLRMPYKGKTLDVKVDDKMFLVTDKRIINQSVFYKWGIQVAKVQLVIEKL